MVSRSCDLANDKLNVVQACPFWPLEKLASRIEYLKSRKGREELRRGNLPGLHFLNYCTLAGLLSTLSKENNMPRFAHNPRLHQAVVDSVQAVRHQFAQHGYYDSHDVINWLNVHRNAELNQIYNCYHTCRDPEMTGDQQIARYLYALGEVKIGEQISSRTITRNAGYNRNGTCRCSIWRA